MKGKVSVSVALPRRGTIARFRTSILVLTLLFSLSACSLFLLGIIVSDHGRIGLSRLDEGLSLKNLYSSWVRTLQDNKKLVSRAALLEEEVTLLRERLLSLQMKRDESKGYETKLREKLTKLEAVVRSAVSLGLIDRQPLRAKSIERGDRAEAGVGGAELDCGLDGENCYGRDNYKVDDYYTNSSANLIEQIERYTEALRALPLGLPTRGSLTSPFGIRMSPFGEGLKFHEGLDVSVPYGKPVQVTGDGMVVAVRYDPTYGNVVDVRHSPAIVTRYAHLSRTYVREGAKITRGQVIGLAGSTGRSTGPHLHYEVRVWGQAKNPMRFLKLAEHLSSFASVG